MSSVKRNLLYLLKCISVRVCLVSFLATALQTVRRNKQYIHVYTMEKKAYMYYFLVFI